MKFYGELLIFVLLFVTNIRVFFVDSAKKDSLAALAPITFILSILQIAAWGLGVFTALGLIISFLVLLSNFHALFRYGEKLYVDHYSPLMMVWAIFTSILSIGAIVALFIFKPVEINNRKLGIDKTVYKYSGEFRTGFDDAGKFQKVTATLYEYKEKEEVEPIHKDESYKEEEKENTLAQTKVEVNSEKEKVEEESTVIQNSTTNLVLENGKGIKGNEIVLFVPDKRGDTYSYEPLLQLLAKDGYTVVSADFYSKDCKWFHSIFDLKVLRRLGMVVSSRTDKHNFEKQREFYTYNIRLEVKALIKMLKDLYGKDVKIFIISDGMSNTAVSDIVKTNKTNVVGSYSLNSIPEYKTSGYGCIKETAPVLYTSMKLPKEEKLHTPRLLVENVKQHINFETKDEMKQ